DRGRRAALGRRHRGPRRGAGRALPRAPRRVQGAAELRVRRLAAPRPQREALQAAAAGAAGRPSSHVMAAVPSPEEVAVRHAITTVLQDYARGVDDRDWDLVRRCYHPDAVDDHGVYRGDVEGFVAHFARQARAWDRTAHYVFEP